jgi:heme oxygenase (biliverdin-producing, ferredoxin)
MTKTVSNQNSLSKSLYEATQSVHAQIENHPFLLQLRDGKLSPENYVQYLVDLHAIYSALEEEMESKRHLPEIHTLYYKDLCRTSSLHKDIQSFKPIQRDPTKAAQTYASHIHHLSETMPVLLLAHAYLRYLGDLSGGRMLQKNVNAAYPGGHDAFYDFQTLLGPNAIGAKVVEFKNEWKRRLDALPLNESQRQKMIEEAKKGFEFTRQLFNAIDLNDHSA